MSFSLELPSLGSPLKRKKKRTVKTRKTKSPYRYAIAFDRGGVVQTRKFRTLERAQEFRVFIKRQPEVSQVSGIKTL